MQRHNLIIAIAIITICVLLNTEVRAQNEETYFGAIGEGYTAENLSEGIYVRWRMFSVPDIKAICEAAGKPDHLIAQEDQIEVVVGETFSLDDLSVIAVDSNDKPLKPIPITVNTDAGKNEIIDIDEYIRTGGGIIALKPGTFQLWIRPFCSGPGPNPYKGIFVKFIIKSI